MSGIVSIAVNQAILELKIDLDNSVYDHDAVDSLIVNPYADSLRNDVVLISGILSRDPEREDVFRGDISNLLQYIVSENVNFGFKIGLEFEQMSLSRFVLKNEKADPADRPRLIISYTSKN